MSLFLTMNATDRALQLDGAMGYHNTGDFAFSGYLSHLLYDTSHTQLMYMERGAWWFHIAGIFAFLNYLPYSKHLHILLAFPNAYYQRLEPMGKMDNMEQIEKEVEKGTIKRIYPMHLLMHLLSMTIFPFVAKPMMTRNMRLSDSQFKQIMEQRKTEIPKFIIDSIKK